MDKFQIESMQLVTLTSRDVERLSERAAIVCETQEVFRAVGCRYVGYAVEGTQGEYCTREQLDSDLAVVIAAIGRSDTCCGFSIPGTTGAVMLRGDRFSKMEPDTSGDPERVWGWWFGVCRKEQWVRKALEFYYVESQTAMDKDGSVWLAGLLRGRSVHEIQSEIDVIDRMRADDMARIYGRITPSPQEA